MKKTEYTLDNMLKDRYSILDVTKETKTAIIFKAEHLENETQHLIEIDKEVFGDSFSDSTTTKRHRLLLIKGGFGILQIWIV